MCGTDTISVEWASPSGLGFGFSSRDWWAIPRKSDMFGEMTWPFYLDDWNWACSDVDLLLVGPGLSDNEELPLVCWYWVICSGLNKGSWCWQPDSHVNQPYGNLWEVGWDWLEWSNGVFSSWQPTQTKLSGLLPELLVLAWRLHSINKKGEEVWCLKPNRNQGKCSWGEFYTGCS